MFISRVDATKAGMRRVMVIFSFSSRQYVCSMYAVCMQYVCSMYAVCMQYVCSMHTVCTQYAVCMKVCYLSYF